MIWVIEEFDTTDSDRLEAYYIFDNLDKAKNMFKELCGKEIPNNAFDEDSRIFSVLACEGKMVYWETSITEREFD
jgi:hypothetical protein